MSLKIDGEIVSYADDTVILFSGESWDEVRLKAAKDLKQIKDWFDLNLLTMNEKKTKYIPFCSYRNGLPTFSTLDILETDITVHGVTEIKYLGVTLDSHLRWDAHARNINKKIRSLLYAFGQLREFMDRKRLLIVYCALVESVLRYGILVWGGLNNTHLHHLHQTHKKLLKIMFKKDSYYSSKLLFQENNIFNIRQMYTEKLFLYQSKQGNVSKINCEHNLRIKNEIAVPKAQKTVGQNCFSYLAPRLFNRVPDSIKNIKNYKQKCAELKKWILVTDMTKVLPTL